MAVQGGNAWLLGRVGVCYVDCSVVTSAEGCFFCSSKQRQGVRIFCSQDSVYAVKRIEVPSIMGR
jgi:hypothetical protein